MLHQALGSPPLAMRVPARTTPAWRQAEFLLRRALQEADLPAVRSPHSLWNLLHQTPWPHPTWAELCANRTLNDLAAPLLAARRHGLPGILIWNVRYLKSTTAHKNQIKLAILLKATSNRLALLQETHWSDHEIGVWSACFPGRTVIATPAYEGAGGGFGGGTAIIIPHDWEVLDSGTLVPGCANYAVVRQNGTNWRLISVYLPPDRVDEVIAQLAHATEDLPAMPTFWGGDLNLQNAFPRSNEVEAAANWAALLARHGSLHSHLVGPTRIGTDGESQIDAIACPAASAGSYSVRKAWKLSLSDHALLYADPAGVRPARRDEALTPAEFRSLPDEARADLRRLYAGLERTFDVPLVDLTGADQPASWTGPALPGHLPQDHPAQDDNDADTASQNEPTDDDAGAPQTPPWLPTLMEFGRDALSATIRDWLKHWRKKGKHTSPGILLHHAVTEQRTCRPTGVLAAWLTDAGWDGNDLRPDEAAAWEARWKADQTQRRAATLSPWQRGVGAERPTLAQQYRIGREIYKKTHRLTGVRGPDGQWCDRVTDVDSILWNSRSDIWQTAPPLPWNGHRLQARYFMGGRRIRTTPRPQPSWERLASLVLIPNGSGPGVDGEPYEVYHLGARFVSCLLGQAWHAADRCPHMLHVVLGASVDLLVWILKKPDAEHPNDFRPLHLPSCFRRLFGASLADHIGPMVEPQLAPDQAAKKGGQCGPNIKLAVAHLGSDPVPVGPPGDAWNDLLGPFAPIVDGYIADSVRGLGPPPSTAVLFCDQNKAFERLSLQWIAGLLKHWGLPPWLQHALLALVADRQVQTCKGRYKGPLRYLLRSIGMGGTVSPLLWNMGYDPIIETVGAAAAGPCPTYVDDLASLVQQAEQALRVAIALPWASYCAGLLVQSHECRGLILTHIPDGLLDLCEQLPITLGKTHNHLNIVRGLTPELTRRILASEFGEAVRDAWVWHEPCTCSFKTALVPASGHDWWRALMEHSPFGASCVKLQWPYLGATITSRATDITPPQDGRLTRDMVDSLLTGTWGKPIAKMGLRAITLKESTPSPSRSAAAWNAYMVSLVPYPAHYMAPSPTDERLMQQHLRVAVGLAGTNWVPAYIMTGLGILFQVPGCPRCPAAAARAVAALAHSRDDVWGPAPARKRARTRWNKLISWARAQPQAGAPARPKSRVLTAAKAAIIILRHNDNPAIARSAALGRALYVAAWGQMYGRHALTWQTESSSRRRWAAGTGQEWVILTHTQSYTAAHHVLRLLANGLPGHARWRDAQDRFPHQCTSCGLAGASVWHTASASYAGHALCRHCLGSWSGVSSLWPLLRDDQIPHQLHELAQQLRTGRDAVPVLLPLHPSPYGCCPLCGLGEASNEHVWMWCTAVALAWSLVRPGGSPDTVADAIMHPGDHTHFLAAFLHQVGFRYSIALGRAPLDPDTAARLINSGIVYSVLQGDDCDETVHDLASILEGSVWTRTRLSDSCQACCPGPPAWQILHGSARPHGLRTGDRIGGDLRRLPVTGTNVPADTALAHLRCETARGGWLLAGPGWFPCPRTTNDLPSARWDAHFCRVCQQHCLTLRSNHDLGNDHEVTVRTAPFPDGDAAQWPLEVTFDGGARTVGESDKVAGAGATLWRHSLDGSAPRLIASCVIALPGSDNAQFAETSGCRAGLGLLPAADPDLRAARIAGDNLAVVRYGAGTGRYRRLQLCDQMDQGLRPLAERGWMLSWIAIRRRLNKAADRLATLGVFWAARLKAAGSDTVTIWTVWHDSPTPPTPSYFPTSSCPTLDPGDVEECVTALERGA